MAESTTSMNSHINLEAKLSGKPVAGKRHNGFDEAGVGNVSKGAGLRASAKALELPPYPKVNAPVLDPTCEGLEVKFLWSTHLLVSAYLCFRFRR